MPMPRKFFTLSFLLAAFFCISTARVIAQQPRVDSSRGQQLVAYQWILTSLTPCVSSPCAPKVYPALTVVDHTDAYFGNIQNGIASAGTLTIGTASNVTLTFTDGNGVVWAAPVFTAATSGTITYSLGSIAGMYMAKSFTVTCADGSSGTGCAAALLQIFYQKI